jgi:membrane-associated protease RseP (regulator of RpoE activity)
MNVLLLFGLLLLVAFGAHRIAVRALGVEGVGFLALRYLPPARRSPRSRRIAACTVGPLVTYLVLIALCAAALSTVREYAAVLRPRPGSPAERAGLRVGDRVTAAAGAPVESFGDLQAQVERAHRAPIPLRLLREGRSVEVVISPDADGHIGVEANGERLPLKVSRLASSIWLPGVLLVQQLEVLGQLAAGSVPSEAVLTRVSQVRRAAPRGSSLGWWLFVIAESGSLAWPLLVVWSAGCLLLAERRLASAASRPGRA